MRVCSHLYLVFICHNTCDHTEDDNNCRTFIIFGGYAFDRPTPLCLEIQMIHHCIDMD